MWYFDGNYNDAVGSYHGYSTPGLPSFYTGYFGQAIFFNATARQALYAPFIPLNNVSFTVEAWIMPTAYSGQSDYSLIGLCPIQVTNKCLHINIRNLKLYFGFYFNDITGTSTIQLNKWIHVAFVFDVTNYQQSIYLDGILERQAIQSSALRAESGNVTFGTNEGVATPNNFFEVTLKH